MARPRRFRLTWPLCVRLGQRLGLKSRARPQAEIAEETITENISTKGCYFYVSKKPALGSSAEMKITVPGNSLGLGNGSVHCYGKVLRVDSPSVGGKVGVACSIDSYAFRLAKAKPMPHSAP